MRLPAAIAATRALSRVFSAGRGSAKLPLRQALLLSGVGLSVLALANAELARDTCGVADAQCDARYTPPEVDASAFTVPLDGELFLPVANSRATRVSCATYKANFPIEDKFNVHVGDNGDVFAAVLDGHGGWQVSEYARKSLIDNVQKELAALRKTDTSGSSSSSNDGDKKKPLSNKKVAAAIQRGFGRTDREIMEDVAAAFKLGFGAVARCGSCALLVFVDGGAVHVANAGDIRAVLGRLDTEHSKEGEDASASSSDVVAVPMSRDHNAMSLVEQEKLRKEHPGEANVFTCRHPESCYVKSALQPTRALGDFSLKYSEFNGPPYVNGDRSAGRHFAAPYSPPYITAIPEVKHHTLDESDQFLIVGSDGLWDYLDNQEAVDIVREQVLAGKQATAGRALVERVLQKAAKRYEMSYQDLLSLPPGNHRRRRHDDTTVVVLFFE